MNMKSVMIAAVCLVLALTIAGAAGQRDGSFVQKNPVEGTKSFPALLWTKEPSLCPEDVMVVDISWVTSIGIQKYRTVSGEGWSLPAGAELTETKTELHHYESVLDHYEEKETQRVRQVLDHYETYMTYEDAGNGVFSEVEHQRPVYRSENYTETEQVPVYIQVPRYATKYYYTESEWVLVAMYDFSGKDRTPVWLKSETDLGEDERLCGKQVEYQITVCDPEGNQTVYLVDETAWRILENGDILRINPNDDRNTVTVMDANGNVITETALFQN